MSHLVIFFSASVVLVTGLLTLCVWTQRATWLKAVALATGALLIPVGYAGYLDLLSQPKPVSFEWTKRTTEIATVLGSIIREEQGMYLWLQIDGIDEPRSYVLPWDRELAEELQTAQREAEENGSDLRMTMPFEPSWDDREQKFYAMPQPAMPPKDAIPEMGPLEYQHPGLQT